MSLGAPEIILLLLLALVLFGPKRLPELGKGLGQGIREFKKGTRDLSAELKDALHEEPKDVPTEK
ncbi:MAG TPA: twin-arginine translocase TatA/TatE family subunit [Deinococcales bacterium]|nr:twin-arginine translocase TatA/TatE family subunit [Deinococcales bacterium]